MARTSLEHAFIKGGSLWSNGKTFVPVKECAGFSGERRHRLRVARSIWTRSDKARLQWTLEQQFREFEGRKWPAAAVESSPAARR